jgi:stage IV sporulation protein FB
MALAVREIRGYRLRVMIRFTLFGIPVRVEPWFWISLLLLGGGIGANTKEELMLLSLFVLAGFFSVLVHELGHALTGRACGARSEVTLHAFGGVARFEGAWFTRRQDFLVTAAGPGAQLLLALAVWLAFPHLSELRSVAGYFWRVLFYISLIWALLNLLPVFPLDGGQMLKAILGPARERTTLWVSIVTAVVAAVLVFKYTGSLIFPVFLGLFAYQAWKRLQGMRQW